MNSVNIRLLVSSLCLLASACSLAPDLKDPIPKPPAQFKEAALPKDAAIWKPAQPADAKDKGQWWKIFADPKLDMLETQAGEANQPLKAALARVKQARAEAGIQRGGLFPSASINASATSQGGTNARFPGAQQYRYEPYRLYDITGTVSYELDLFGRASDTYLASRLLAEGQDATYKNTLLALQADLAQTYFTLRLLDEEIRILQETVGIRDTASAFIKHQFDAGISSQLDYSRAESELQTARADLFAAQRQRSAQEHALATLLGKNPSEFSFEYTPLAPETSPPTVPAGIPSALLERRPDIATAQRQMAAANAQIGVARAAFFPSISLSATGGSQTSDFSKLFQWVSHTWSIGPNINIPLFSGGSNFANLDKSKAKFEEETANYRQRVLDAFREVEDGLSGTKYLADQENAAKKAAQSARMASKLSFDRYQIGDINYLDVVDTERTRFATELNHASVRIDRYTATIGLIRALGGGWE